MTGIFQNSIRNLLLIKPSIILVRVKGNSIGIWIILKHNAIDWSQGDEDNNQNYDSQKPMSADSKRYVIDETILNGGQEMKTGNINQQSNKTL